MPHWCTLAPCLPLPTKDHRIQTPSTGHLGRKAASWSSLHVDGEDGLSGPRGQVPGSERQVHTT